ncbi:hypothetical protein [Flavobacterium sp. SM2513]|uniref:hypothetical protein n=1 Tax=Flavobacterium sp. SM2513 TaxID=3424766 RepID=UPI003D7F1D8F
MRKVLKVRQSGYYRWIIAATSKRLQKKTVLKEKIKPFILNPNNGTEVHDPRAMLELAKQLQWK